jgi:uridine monophosphate synthetase
VSSGQSKLEGIKPLEQLGAKIDIVLVVIDREQGSRENLEKLGYQFHALATISELVHTLLKNNKISNKEAKIITDYMQSLHTS